MLIAIGIFLPSKIHLQRTIEISAPAASIFALLDDLDQTGKWSPWVAKDPNALVAVSSPSRGAGASITWTGQVVGHGRQVITESHAYDRVVSTLYLGNRHPANSTLELRKSKTGILVTWSFDDDFGLDLFRRYSGLLTDKVVGTDYQQGLGRLKTMAEYLPKTDFSDLEIEHLNIEATNIVYLTVTSAPQASAISTALGEAYFELLNFIDKYQLAKSGAPMSIGGTFVGTKLQFDAAIPVSGLTDSTPRNTFGVKIGKTYAGPVIRARHFGSYHKLGETHDKLAAYLLAYGIKRNGSAWETYVNKPSRVEDQDLLTYVYYPIRED